MIGFQLKKVCLNIKMVVSWAENKRWTENHQSSQPVRHSGLPSEGKMPQSKDIDAGVDPPCLQDIDAAMNGLKANKTPGMYTAGILKIKKNCLKGLFHTYPIKLDENGIPIKRHLHIWQKGEATVWHAIKTDPFQSLAQPNQTSGKQLYPWRLQKWTLYKKSAFQRETSTR